ncbi:UNVERIFIED_CONTAM: hypothetical protein K2H54_035103 [Gekko kuhli]
MQYVVQTEGHCVRTSITWQDPTFNSAIVIWGINLARGGQNVVCVPVVEFWLVSGGLLLPLTHLPIKVSALGVCPDQDGPGYPSLIRSQELSRVGPGWCLDGKPPRKCKPCGGRHESAAV